MPPGNSELKRCRRHFRAPTLKNPQKVKLKAMNAREVIDRFGSQTPRFKTAAVICVVVAVLAVLGGVFYLGYSTAIKRHEHELTESEKRAAVAEANAARHLEGETQLAAQNSLLRKQNEAMAEILEDADTKREVEAAADLARRWKERGDRMNDIDADSTHDEIVCGTCAESAASGFPLSAGFCDRCRGQ